MTSEDIATAIEALVAARAETATVCPSEVARCVAGDGEPWRPLMQAVRAVAATLVGEGRLSVTQRGREVDALSASGPIRLGRPRS